MKKTIALFFVALVAVSMTFAFEFRSVGIETGGGTHISADMEIIEDLDAYARFGYTGRVCISMGAQYRVADLKISNTILPIKPGAQMGFYFGDGYYDSYFGFSLLVTCSFSYDTDCFTAFVRPGLGLYTYSAKYSTYKFGDTIFDVQVETGVAFLFK